jgi:hypothetical protein
MIYIIALLFGFYVDYTPNQPYPFKRGLWVFVMFVLIGILGWRVFGEAIRG